VKRLDLRDGMPVRVFEVTAGTVAFEKVKSTTLSEDDIAILKKLLQFKFEERTPERLENALSASDKRKLNDMIRQHIVNVYYEGKYSKSGVYNVPTLVYRQYLQQAAQASARPTAPAAIPHVEYKSPAAIRPSAAASAPSKAQVPVKLTPIQLLEKNGFLIMQSEMDAKEFSDSYSSRIRRKEIFGVRGFDKKYYIVKSSFVTKNESKVRAFLKSGAKSADKVAEALGVEPQGAVALLTIMNEEGELIERKRGIFALAD